MKFSEHVVVGSTIVKLQPWCYLQNGCGCLIGMAGAAKGETNLGGMQGSERIGKLFPWLEYPRVTPCPVCFTNHPNYCGSISCVAYHVKEGYWTFDQALDYIRSIEPQDEPDTPDTVVPVWNRGKQGMLA